MVGFAVIEHVLLPASGSMETWQTHLEPLKAQGRPILAGLVTSYISLIRHIVYASA